MSPCVPDVPVLGRRGHLRLVRRDKDTSMRSRAGSAEKSLGRSPEVPANKMVPGCLYALNLAPYWHSAGLMYTSLQLKDKDVSKRSCSSVGPEAVLPGHTRTRTEGILPDGLCAPNTVRVPKILFARQMSWQTLSVDVPQAHGVASRNTCRF